jgi:hypothetical protein
MSTILADPDPDQHPGLPIRIKRVPYPFKPNVKLNNNFSKIPLMSKILKRMTPSYEYDADEKESIT